MYFIPDQTSLLAELEAAVNRTQSKLNRFTSIKEGKIEAKISTVDLVKEINRLRGELAAYTDSLAMVKAAFVQESNERSLQDVTETTEGTYHVLPLDTRFNWGQDNYPSNVDIVYMEFDDGYHPVKKINRFTFKSLVANKVINLRNEDKKQFYGDVIVSEVVEDTVEIKTELSASVIDGELEIVAAKCIYGNIHKSVAVAKLEHLKISELDKLIHQLQTIRDNLNT